MGSEKRKAERVQSNLFADIRTVPLLEKVGRAVVVDVSLSGFALETESDLNDDQTYEVDIEVPITMRAKIVRRITSGRMKKYGVLIVGQSFFHKFLLKKLLKGKRNTIKF